MRQIQKTFIALLMAGMMLGGNPVLTQSVQAEPVTMSAVAVGTGIFLLQWVAGHVLDAATGLDGSVDTRELKAGLARLEKSDQAHAQLLRRLQRSLDDKMSRQEVESLLRSALGEIDQRLVKMADEIARHDRELQTQALRLGLLDQQLAVVKQQVAENHRALANQLHQHTTRLGQQASLLQEHESRLDRHDETDADLYSEISQLRADYPRITSQQQSVQLIESAVAALFRNDLQEARRGFLLAQAVVPNDPDPAYGLAVTLKRQGESVEADTALARGIQLERTSGRLRSNSWVTRGKFQGRDRFWIENARNDPVYGVFAPRYQGVVTNSADQYSPHPTRSK